MLLTSAQISSAQRSVNWRFYRLADGLPESGCIAISFSPQNKLLARHLTQSLISELDGYTIRTLPSPEAGKSRVYPSPGGQLWTVVPGGLEEFQDGSWTFHPVAQIAAEPHGGPTHVIDPVPLVPARQGRVILLLPDRLAEFNTESPEEHTIVLRTSDQTDLGHFLGLCQARDGGLWLAAEHGLAKIPGPIRNLQPQTEWHEFRLPGNLPLHDLKTPHETFEGGVLCLAETTTNSQRVVAWFDGQNWDIWPLGGERLRQVWGGADRSVWAMSIDSLFEWDTSRRELVPNEEFSARQFFDVALEPSGAFWVATSDGLFRHAPALWRKPAPLRQLNSPVRCLAADSEDRLWFVSGNNVDSLQNGRLQHHPIPATGDRRLLARALFVLPSGTVVLAMEDVEGGEGDELFECRPGENGFAALPSEGPARKFRALGLLKTANLCLHLLNGSPSAPGVLFQYDGRAFKPLQELSPSPPLSSNVFCLFNARNGDLWAGAENGTACYHDNKWRAFVAPDKSVPEGVTCFAELADGKIWCGTQDQLWEFDGKNWAVVRRGFDHINSVQVARDGSVWVASNAGLYRHFQEAWVENGTEEGLASTAVGAVLEDNRGQLWAATSHGLSQFHPEADPDPPQTTILPLSDSGDSVPAAGIITVNFRGQDKWKYTTPDRLLYSWRRDEQDWSPFQEATHVPLSELSAGKHVFQVRAMDRNCNIEAKAQRDFFIILPWYKETRLVLISLAGLATALFFAGLAFNRHRRLLHSYAEVEKKVTERTNQLEIANRELVQSQKMNALGTLAAGIAHDFNNILSIIKGSAQIIEDNLDNPEKIRTRAERIRTVVEQGAGIVKAMLGFSRQSDQAAVPCDVNAVVAETLKLLGDRFLREVDLSFLPEPDLPQVLASKDLIQQILLNFLFNAAESVNGNRQIILRTGVLEKLPPDVVLHPSSNGRCLSVSVQDFGCGVSAENLPRIFEPFFTTKALSTRRGTGLGLSMVYELAKKLGAGLAVVSQLDQGSTFTLILPALETVSTDIPMV